MELNRWPALVVGFFSVCWIHLVVGFGACWISLVVRFGACWVCLVAGFRDGLFGSWVSLVAGFGGGRVVFDVVVVVLGFVTLSLRSYSGFARFGCAWRPKIWV